MNKTYHYEIPQPEGKACGLEFDTVDDCMDREAAMRELDRILDSHGITVDRDAIKEDISKVFDSVYSKGWFDGYYEG